MSRALDYLVTDKDVNGKNVIAVGQSRLGKTVLWAGAQDQRFAMVIASCSGEGGAALSRRDFGENLDNMTTTYLYQFCEKFKRYYKHWNDLAFHEHTGRHAILVSDWKVFLDFVDQKLKHKP